MSLGSVARLIYQLASFFKLPILVLLHCLSTRLILQEVTVQIRGLVFLSRCIDHRQGVAEGGQAGNIRRGGVAVRDVGIQFLGLKLSLRLLARVGERAEKEPELERECSPRGLQLLPGKPNPDRLWPTLSNPSPSPGGLLAPSSASLRLVAESSERRAKEKDSERGRERKREVKRAERKKRQNRKGDLAQRAEGKLTPTSVEGEGGWLKAPKGKNISTLRANLAEGRGTALRWAEHKEKRPGELESSRGENI
ncbi:hypothetical protein EYF80_005890 [Liparis tanakae]|uniref:Uncharacterized protein n=1 Tax=Liparis tanakae TaxID=230148 RepID=A0A4Z2J1C6_9TELE|nr:hypothetical protein EYF80_005890 [Liparis tanakae]